VRSARLRRVRADVTDRAGCDRIAALNADPGVHGILVQLRLAGRINARAYSKRSRRAKNIDGFHFENLGDSSPAAEARCPARRPP